MFGKRFRLLSYKQVGWCVAVIHFHKWWCTAILQRKQYPKLHAIWSSIQSESFVYFGRVEEKTWQLFLVIKLSIFQSFACTMLSKARWKEIQSSLDSSPVCWHTLWTSWKIRRPLSHFLFNVFARTMLLSSQRTCFQTCSKNFSNYSCLPIFTLARWLPVHCRRFRSNLSQKQIWRV